MTRNSKIKFLNGENIPKGLSENCVMTGNGSHAWSFCLMSCFESGNFMSKNKCNKIYTRPVNIFLSTARKCFLATLWIDTSPLHLVLWVSFSGTLSGTLRIVFQSHLVLCGSMWLIVRNNFNFLFFALFFKFFLKILIFCHCNQSNFSR